MTQKVLRILRLLSKRGVELLITKIVLFLKFRYDKTYFSNNNILFDKQLPNVSDRFWLLGEESVIRHTNSANIGVPIEFAPYLSDYKPESRFVCVLSSCFIAGSSPISYVDDSRPMCFSSGGSLILATASGNLDQLKVRGIYLDHLNILDLLFLYRPFRSKHIDDTLECIFPLIEWYKGGGYYHWITETLPKLRALEDYESKTGIKPSILLDADPSQFMIESLTLMGYTTDRFTIWQPHKVKRINKLIVTNHRPHFQFISYSQSIDDYHWLRAKMRSQLGNISVNASRKIYISRQEAEKGRKIENYDEVMFTLASRGFESVVMESLSFKQQIQLISEADVILGPHGAGFVNMIFSDNPTIIEILPKDDLRPYFYMLSDLLKNEYHSIIAESDIHGNLIVNVEQLSKVLDKANI